MLATRAEGAQQRARIARRSVEDIIIESMDANRIKPSVSDDRRADLKRFHYDLYNLEFCDGIGYAPRAGEPKRVVAFKTLFNRQGGTSFILLLTINVRDTVGLHVTKYLADMSAGGSESAFAWYSVRRR